MATPVKQAAPTPAPKPGLVLPRPIPSVQNELFYLLGHLRGTNISTADRITELVLELQAKAHADLNEAVKQAVEAALAAERADREGK
jgi:hypothetical protein